MYTRDEMIDVLQSHIVNIKFKKADGSEREMICTLKEDLTVTSEKKTDRVKPINKDVLPIYDLEKKGWRSFRVESIINFDPIVV